MAGGRPRLYFSPAEKKVADGAKRTRYYHRYFTSKYYIWHNTDIVLRHKDNINTQMRERYRLRYLRPFEFSISYLQVNYLAESRILVFHRKPRTPANKGAHCLVFLLSFQSTTSPSRLVPEVSSESYESLRAQLHALLGGPTDKFFERICYSYLASVKDGNGDLTIIEKEIQTVSVLTSATHQLQDRVLQARGISQHWERHERLRKCLQEVSACLEDMICLAMVDVGDLRDTLTTRKLRGQIAGDFIANL
jgi:hypothetical protein